MQFEKLPRSIRALTVIGYGYYNSFLRYGKEFHEFSNFLRETDRLSQTERESHQLNFLRRHIRQVAPETPFLRDHLSLDPDDGNDVYSVLRNFPPMEKTEMRQDPMAYVNQGVKSVISSSTSGTTGSPMRFGHDRASLQRRMALLKDHLRIAGLPVSSKGIRLSGRIISNPRRKDPKPWLFNPAERQVFVSTYHLNRDHKQQISKLLTLFQPDYLDGYPSAILELLRLAYSSEERFNRLSAIITTAETLHKEVREEIEELSRAKVLDYYAASEGVPPIQQCLYGTYHVRWQGGVFEIAQGDRIVPEGDGELVCTSFLQQRNPLIRYRTGDTVAGYSRSGRKCACGLRTPTVESVLGRVEDQVATQDGTRIGMFTYRTLKNIDGLEAAQVVQREITNFEVLAVLKPEADRNLVSNSIQHSFERALGYSISFSLRVVSEIPKGPNGKTRLVISKVQR